MSKKKCCEIIYMDFTNVDCGWDAYRKSDCYELQPGVWIPRWFDNALVDSAETKQEAMRQIKEEWHIPNVGMCLVTN